jgi:hypothetical protein
MVDSLSCQCSDYMINGVSHWPAGGPSGPMLNRKHRLASSEFCSFWWNQWVSEWKPASDFASAGDAWRRELHILEETKERAFWFPLTFVLFRHFGPQEYSIFLFLLLYSAHLYNCTKRNIGLSLFSFFYRKMVHKLWVPLADTLTSLSSRCETG